MEEIKVYSLTKANRESFAAEMGRLTGANIRPVDSPEECVAGVDIIMAATSSIVPVIKAEWLREGMHVSCVKSNEVDGAVIDRFALHHGAAGIRDDRFTRLRSGIDNDSAQKQDEGKFHSASAWRVGARTKVTLTGPRAHFNFVCAVPFRP